MQASSIEAREKFPGAWSNVSRLEVLTRESPDRLQRFELRQRRELDFPARNSPSQDGGAEVFLDGMNRWQIRRTQELFVEVDVPRI